jgi:hypothetical protein
MKPVHACSYSNVVGRIKQDQIVKAHVVDMPSIPAGANPFHHDAYSMGTDLTRGWMVMHDGFNNELGHENMYLVNTTTGQRIQLAFEPKEPVYNEEVYVGDAPDINPDGLYVWLRSGLGNVEWVSYEAFVHRAMWDKAAFCRISKHSPPYVFIDKWFVLADVVADADRFAKWCDEQEVVVAPDHPGVKMGKFIVSVMRQNAEEEAKNQPEIIIEPMSYLRRTRNPGEQE